MKRFVNGVEIELEASSPVEIVELNDRLGVRTAEGLFTAAVARSGDVTLVSYKGRQYRIEKGLARARSSKGGGSGDIFAPMPGVIVDVFIEDGQTVEQGQKLLVLEAMKTQQPLVSPISGVVTRLSVAINEQVQEGQLLVAILPAGN